ncbi:unnamed protein product [Mytilus edulis]|uniref:DUF7869 domain-containing protein n=1 Tax=Mytilus edulis TaxID=6550 RepID=A0A8S3Q8P1_MYTED|nr:unnamed protein product [Mytilus edulis]
MDWFNNIGCEELENEAVAYFEQYIGSIPEVLASSNNELNVSDNSDSDIENDESDIENTCDTIQARAREFYSTSVIQDQSENTCSLNQNDELEDPSRLRINALFANDCNCTKKCFTKLSTFREQAYEVSLSVCEFTKAERDIYLLSNLEITDSVFRGGKRERKRYRYSFQGVEICEFTWRNIYNIGRSEFKSLKQHLNANGVTPRSHGLSGRKSNHGHSFEVIENTIKFIKRYADEFGLPLPAAPRATDNTPPILLPCSESKKYEHSKYVSSCVNSEQQYVQLTVFKEVWNACVPHIQFMKPKTDRCKTCFQLREDISGSISEDAKLVTTQKLIDHIQSARTEREYYKLCTQRSRDELKLAESPIGKYNTPCSKNFENVHYTFDFSQYVNLPHSSQQVGALYFLTPRKVQIFGVCDENFPMQTNYLIDEQQTIGENGSRTHGPNAVLSMLHHYLHGNTYGEKACHFHADNSVGQNKNKTTLHYLLWRCGKGLHKTINLHFMIAGHTKCLCDACFGMLKFRKSDVNTVSQLVKIVDNSAKCNRSEVFNENDDDENSLKWYRWDNFFTKYFKPLRGIGKFHHFRFTSDEVGVVFARETLDEPKKRLVLLMESAKPTGVAHDTSRSYSASRADRGEKALSVQ